MKNLYENVTTTQRCRIPMLFSGWYYSHYALANVIWYVLVGLGLISWGVSLVRKIRSVI